MNLNEFRQALSAHPGCGLRFQIDAQQTIADHFHVTEVGRVEKRFVDCGGVRRETVACVLQTLVAHDLEHRLTTDKLASIMQMADNLGIADDVPVEVEHQERSISTDAVDSFSAADGVLQFRLSRKQTVCLAEDLCGIAPAGLPVLDGGDCCGTSGCC